MSFVLFTFLLQFCFSLGDCLRLQQSPLSLQFPILDVVITWMLCPVTGAFIFRVMDYISYSRTWSDSICKADIALQEFQVVALMLCRMAFHISHTVVILYMDNSTPKAYLCNQGGKVSPFLSRLAYHILNMANKHGITLFLAYIPTNLNVEANYLWLGWLVPEMHHVPHIAQVAF